MVVPNPAGNSFSVMMAPRQVPLRIVHQATARSEFRVKGEVVEETITVYRDAVDQEDLQWLLRNFKKLLERYEGKFVAICKERVVATGDSWGEAFEKAQERGFTDAMVIRITRDKWSRWYGAPLNSVHGTVPV